MSEYYAALRFVVGKLREVTEDVYERGSVQGAQVPYLTYELTPESHISHVGGNIALGRGELTVFAVGKGNAASVKSLVEEVRQVLHKSKGDVDGHHVEVWETAPAKMPPYSINNIFYYELGARYRVVVHKLAVTP